MGQRSFKLNRSSECVLIQKVLIQLLQFRQNDFFQFCHGHKGTRTGFSGDLTRIALQVISITAFVRSHGIPTVHAGDLPGKRMDHSGTSERLCVGLDLLLYPVPELPIDDGFVSTFCPDPLVLGACLNLSRFIRDTAVFALNQISYVYFVGQDICDTMIFPEGAGYFGGRHIPDAFSSFILRRIWNATIVQDPGNRRFSIPISKQRKNLNDDISGLLIDDQNSPSFGIFLVPIRRKGSDMEPVFSAAPQNTADIVRHILQIPLVDQTIDLAGLLITLISGVGVVNDTDEANAPDGEQTMNILFDELKLSGKPRLSFTEDDIKLMGLGICKKTLELRTVTVRSSVIIVAVNIMDIPSLTYGVLEQHCLLVLDAVAVIFFIYFVSIFFGKAAVNCYFHLSISFVMEQADRMTNNESILEFVIVPHLEIQI